MGRNPELIEKKRSRGTVQKVREEKRGSLPVVPMLTKVVAPAWMPKDQKKTFKRVTGILQEWGILAEADLGLVEAYVAALHQWREDQLLIQDNGSYVDKFNSKGVRVGKEEAPWSARARQLAYQIKDLGAQLGFSPVARAKILSMMAPKQEEKDDFAEFLEV